MSPARKSVAKAKRGGQPRVEASPAIVTPTPSNDPASKTSKSRNPVGRQAEAHTTADGQANSARCMLPDTERAEIDEQERLRRERILASVRVTKEDVKAALAASRAGDRSLVAEIQRRINAPVALLLAPRCTAFVKHLGRTCRNASVRGNDLCCHHLRLAEMAAENRKMLAQRENP